MAYSVVLQQQAVDEWGWKLQFDGAVVAEGVGHDRRDALENARTKAMAHKRRLTWTPETVDLEDV